MMGCGEEKQNDTFFHLCRYKIILFFIYCQIKRQPKADQTIFIFMSGLLDFWSKLVLF